MKNRRIIPYKDACLEQLDAGACIAYPKDDTGKNYRYYAVPSFLIIGAAKSSTTTLCLWLSKHPNLISMRREFHFFNLVIDIAKEWKRYVLNPHFAISDDREQLLSNNIHTFEKTPGYYFRNNRDVSVAQYIQQMMPTGKFIIILRNPTDRFYSYYQMSSKENKHRSALPEYISPDFATFVREKRLINDNSLWSAGHYAQHLENWLKYFQREQLLVLITEQFKLNPFSVMEKILQFLELPVFNYRPLAQQNEYGIESLIGDCQSYKSYQPMSEEARYLLDEYYAPWNAKLKKLFPEIDFPW